MRFSLQQMVRAATEEADRRIKLAEAVGTHEGEAEKEKDKRPSQTPPSNKATEPERNETSIDTDKDKTSSVFVEKLASAVEWLNHNFFKGAETAIGAGTGPNTMETNLTSPPGGGQKQSERFGQASSGIPPKNPGTDPKDQGRVNPATTLETTIHNPPGGKEDWTHTDKMKQSAARLRYALQKMAEGPGEEAEEKAEKIVEQHEKKETPAQEKKEEKKEKVAFSVTESGHKLDAAEYNAAARALADMAEANDEYTRKRPGTSYLTGQHMHGVIQRLAGRHHDYAARKHEKGQNAYNPFGGMLTPSRKEKKAGADLSRVFSIIQKTAGEESSGARLSAAHHDSPPDFSKSEEGVPSQPGEVNKQKAYIASNMAAINFTKQQAKAVPKARMGEVIDEPAQKKSTDPVLHENLDAAGKAGVKLSSAKLAAARTLLQKIAEEGAKPEATPEEKERAAKLQEALEAKKKEKEKQSQSFTQEPNSPIGGGY